LPRRSPQKSVERRAISRDDVARMAKLAHLSLSVREEEAYTRELSAILEYFRVIDGAEVSDVTPAYYSTELTNVIRGNQVVVTDSAPILEGVPRRKGRFVRAPRVF